MHTNSPKEHQASFWLTFSRRQLLFWEEGEVNNIPPLVYFLQRLYIKLYKYI